MAPDKIQDSDVTRDEPHEADASAAAPTDDTQRDDESPVELDLQVQVDSPSACERHVTVTISRADIDRYLDEAYSELMPTATVPGFRAGRAPRKLVESRFKQEVSEQIKGSLLMDSLSQISEQQQFTAISEPDLDLEAVEIPDEGPMLFEFDIEVRPEFEMPEWKGLQIERPVREFTDEDVTEQLTQMLARYGQLMPVDRAVTSGDYVTLNLVSKVDGKRVAEEEELLVRVLEKLSFLDGTLEGFDKLIEGAQPGDRRTGSLTLTHDAPSEALRGKQVDVEFEILEVKQIKLPELTEEFLDELGGIESKEQLRELVRANLQRQLDYEQQRKSREQITAALTKAADWELPPGLLKRQSVRELERAVMELRRAGFSEVEIRARENALRQNSAASTARALKEHFILERIAEQEQIDVEQADFDAEVMLIAAQSGESPRRVRAHIEKRGLMDVLQNQIIERKVLDLVQQHANFKDQPYEPRKTTVEAVSVAAGGGEQLPEAKLHTEHEKAAPAGEPAAEAPAGEPAAEASAGEPAASDT